MPYTYKYPRPSVTVDVIIFGLKGKDLKVLLIQRSNDPFKDLWALPGGFVDPDEELEEAAHRELEEETGAKGIFVEQLYTFGKPGRDPRGHVISVAYFALINLADIKIKPASDAKDAQWLKLTELPKLAFDHKEILDKAIERLRGKVRYQPLGFELLPEKFAFSQLQQLYETVLGVEINKRNFRTKINKMKILKEEGQQTEVAHRPAVLYSFDKDKYEELMKSGFNFEI